MIVFAYKCIFLQIEALPRDSEFYGLLYEVQSKNIPGHNFRGYSILGEENNREISVSTYFIQSFALLEDKTFKIIVLRFLKLENVKCGMSSLVWEVNGLVWAVIYWNYHHSKHR